jgi:hypothetical protein
MKSTIKTGSRQIVVEPSKLNPGSLTLRLVNGHAGDLKSEEMVATLSQDQAGALIFALEQAAEAAQLKADCMKALAA